MRLDLSLDRLLRMLTLAHESGRVLRGVKLKWPLELLALVVEVVQDHLVAFGRLDTFTTADAGAVAPVQGGEHVGVAACKMLVQVQVLHHGPATMLLVVVE